jgi:putative membrane protein
MIGDWLAYAYPWTKSLHVISVIAWMAGLFYLPRLFVHHTEQTTAGTGTDRLFRMMERKLFKLIMNPSLIATWLFGLALVFTPGVVDWGAVWPYAKGAGVVAMTWFHMWCGQRLGEFEAESNSRTGRHYRMMNEVPTLLLVVIVVAVIARPF